MDSKEREEFELPIKLNKPKKEKTPKVKLNHNQLRKISNRHNPGNSLLTGVKNNLTAGKKVKNFSRGKIASLSKGSFVRDVTDLSRRTLIKGRIITQSKSVTNKPFVQVAKELTSGDNQPKKKGFLKSLFS